MSAAERKLYDPNIKYQLLFTVINNVNIFNVLKNNFTCNSFNAFHMYISFPTLFFLTKKEYDIFLSLRKILKLFSEVVFSILYTETVSQKCQTLTITCILI